MLKRYTDIKISFKLFNRNKISKYSMQEMHHCWLYYASSCGKNLRPHVLLVKQATLSSHFWVIINN